VANKDSCFPTLVSNMCCSVGLLQSNSLQIQIFSFSDAGKRLGEMWHALSEDVREDYRQRAKDQAEMKLREWHEKMKEFPSQAMDPMAHITSQVVKIL
jgi:hypothetical protein